jgi:DNA-binding NarL/FixJ family response regulator
MGPTRVLVVDDYDPFRRLIRSLLESPALRVIGQACDGLEAVQKAQELQPDLVLLDIGLPKLNGMSAAEQIRKIAPHSRILFLSQECLLDVVERALDLGALGYLQKTRIHSELLLAITSVLAGKQFVSTDLEGKFPERTIPQSPDRHEVEFYSEEPVFLAGVSSFAAAALEAGNPVIVMATPAHREAVMRRLRSVRFDIDDAVQQGRYISLDAAELLSRIMVGGLPDSGRFFEGLSRLVRSASATVKKRHARVAICGECVGILWAEGKIHAAIQLERIGNELIKIHNVEILCAYPLGAFHDDQQRRAIASVCREHSAVRIR